MLLKFFVTTLAFVAVPNFLFWTKFFFISDIFVFTQNLFGSMFFTTRFLYFLTDGLYKVRAKFRKIKSYDRWFQDNGYWRKLSPSHKVNLNPNPNSNANRGQFSSGKIVRIPQYVILPDYTNFIKVESWNWKSTNKWSLTCVKNILKILHSDYNFIVIYP